MTPSQVARQFVDQAAARPLSPERRNEFAVARTQAALKIPREQAQALVTAAETARTTVTEAEPVEAPTTPDGTGAGETAPATPKKKATPKARPAVAKEEVG